MTTDNETLAAALLARLDAIEARLNEQRPAADEVQVIAAQAEAAVQIIEAEADASVQRTEAEAEATTEIVEATAEAEAGEDEHQGASPSPAPDHWLFKPLGRK